VSSLAETMETWVLKFVVAPQSLRKTTAFIAPEGDATDCKISFPHMFPHPEARPAATKMKSVRTRLCIVFEDDATSSAEGIGLRRGFPRNLGYPPIRRVRCNFPSWRCASQSELISRKQSSTTDCCGSSAAARPKSAVR
jgi:hypothetical protein